MAKKNLSFLEEIEENFSPFIKTQDQEGELKTISTGSVSLDFCTGVGGIPIGKFTEIYGVPSSGKTTLALTVAKNAIEKGGKVLYIDAENGLDWPRIMQICPEAEEMSVENPEGNFLLTQPDSIETGLTIAEKGIMGKEFMLIVYDSVPAGVSKTVENDDLEKANVASVARIISRFVARVTFDIRTSGSAFIFINQARDKIGSYVPTIESPGGWAMKHICSLRILLTSDLSKEGTIYQGDEKIGNMCRFTIKKNKMGPPLRTFSFPIIYQLGIDTVRDLVLFSETLGVIIRSGAWYSFNGEKIGQGLVNTVEYLNSNLEILEAVKENLFKLSTKKEIEIDND